MSERYVVRRGEVLGEGDYADGARSWTTDRTRAFVFVDDSMAPLLTAREWAQQHAKVVGGRAVKLVRRGNGRAAS